MATAFFKTMLMTCICLFGFILSSVAFPFVLVAVFLVWASPYAVAAFLEDRRAKKAVAVHTTTTAEEAPSVGALATSR
jgi:hypothetical protein